MIEPACVAHDLLRSPGDMPRSTSGDAPKLPAETTLADALVCNSPSTSAVSRLSRLASRRCHYGAMPELTVRVLTEQDWPVFRAVHLASLQGSPGVFGDTHDQEAAADETFWRSQLTWARRVVAELDGHPCGVVSVGSFSDEP